MPLRILGLIILVCASVAHAEQPIDRGREAVRLELLAGRSGLCALNVAAHPDDEDGATLAWLRRVAGVETHLVLATRGEGGQNEAGPELGAELAARRSRETEEAARILGCKVWYLNCPDFGFSKSDAETLKVWDHDRALERLVRIIRTVKPDLLFTNHDPLGTDHGHHRATGQLLLEAFDAAADPQRFPEQLAKDDLQAWAPAKLYRRLWQPTEETVTLDGGRIDAALGHAPAEFAAWALERHATQGMQRDIRPGDKALRHYLLLKSRLPKPAQAERSLLDGLEPAVYRPLHLQPFSTGKSDATDTVAAIHALQRDITGSASWALEQLDPAPEKSVWLLRTAWESLNVARGELPQEPWPQERQARARRHLEAGLAAALGLRLDARPDDALVCAGQRVKINLRAVNAGPHPIALKKLQFSTEPGWHCEAIQVPTDPLPPGAVYETEAFVTPETRAYPNAPAHRFLEGRYAAGVPVSVTATVQYDGVEFATPASEIALNLAPAYETRIEPDPVLVFDDPDRPDNAEVTVRARLVVTGHRREPWTLYGKLEDNKRHVTQTVQESILAFEREDQAISRDLGFTVQVKDFRTGPYEAATVLWDAQVRYPSPSIRVIRIPLKLPTPLHVGLVSTYDRATGEALERMASQHTGLRVFPLTPDDLRGSDLNALHTIVLDLRATQYRPDVLENRERLKQFMEQGGHVVCLYHKDFDWNEADEDARGRGFFRGQGGGGAIAPYPISLSFRRVTDEHAAVRLIDPTHPLLTKPNKLWDADWEGWVQERGVYFPSKWDPKYKALLESHDAGEEPLDGGLLIAPVGKGSFVYTSFVWYRQLRAGVPGAYRMLANLIAYPRVKE
ncbi:MAG: PIG-L family deacetylase [Planctomycetes bacterium]|nr:PIG-L family deacetylase [Planctomycetota bacterium]